MPFASPQSSGSVEVFVETLQNIPTIGTGGAVRSVSVNFLGTCRTPPKPEVQVAWGTVMNDLAGNQIEYDKAFQGMKAVTALELTNFDQAVVEAMQSVFNVAGDHDLSWADADVGTLMQTEGYWFKVYYRYMRRAIPAMLAVGMPAGACYWGSHVLTMAEQRGAEENTIFLVFGHKAIRNPQTGVWNLKTRDISTVANLQAVYRG